jgi:hypothetical protein
VKPNIIVSFLAISTAIIFYTACNKIDSTDIGSDLIPAVDNVHTFDTVIDAIITRNGLMDDSTIISSSEDNALGYISNDPAFGKTTAAIYAYFQPGSFGTIPFNDSIISIDSVVLSLSAPYVYGDSNSTGKFDVYEIDQSERNNFKDSFDVNTYKYGYKISSPYFATNTLWGSKEQLFSAINDEDSVMEGAVKKTRKNQIRIRLDNSFGDRFINYDTSVYKTDSSFRDHFLGLAIMPDSNYAASNALAYVYLKDSTTRLNFYYHSKQDGVDTALVTTFTVTGYSTANIIRQNHAGSALEASLSNGSTDDHLYIQATPGSYARIEIPGLENISNRVIHRAELIIDKVPSANEEVFTPPSLLFLDAIDTSKHLYRTLQNDLVSSSSTSLQYNVADFGGIFKKDQYIFNISRYIQGIVTRHEENFPLRLYAPYQTRTTYVPPGVQSQVDIEALKTSQENPALGFSFSVLPYVAGSRVVLGGGNFTDPAHKIRLRIIYSKL